MTLHRSRDGIEYQTTDGTAHLALTMKPPTGTSWAMIGIVSTVARNDATLDTRGRTLAFVAKNNAGTPALVGTVTTLQNQGDGGTATWSVTISAGATGIEVFVTGAAATNITWGITTDVTISEV